MSHIVEFSVKGLAGREKNYSHKLNRNVNVFFGENGSGKTSLLKILHSAISGDTDVLTSVPFDSAEVGVYSVAYKRVFTRTIKIDKPSESHSVPVYQSSLPGLEPNVLMTYPHVNNLWYAEKNFQYLLRAALVWTISPEPPSGFKGFADRYLPTSRVYQGSASIAQLKVAETSLTEAQLDAYFADSIKYLWTSYSADIANAVSNAQQKGLANILRAVLSSSGTEKVSINSAQDAKTAYARVSAFLSRQPGFTDILGSSQDFSKRYLADRRLRTIVHDIDTVEKQIEEASAPRERLKHLIQTMFSRKEVRFGEKSIEVETPKHTTIELSALSSGEKQLLRILIEALIASENTIFIDEPELSMHVDWQQRLIKSMTQLNPRAQIVLATHSPEIMADLDEQFIFRL